MKNVPNNRSSLEVHLETLLVDILSIRFHVTLLEIGGETVHVLVVRQNGQRFGAEKAVSR